MNGGHLRVLLGTLHQAQPDSRRLAVAFGGTSLDDDVGIGPLRVAPRESRVVNAVERVGGCVARRLDEGLRRRCPQVGGPLTLGGVDALRVGSKERRVGTLGQLPCGGSAGICRLNGGRRKMTEEA